MTTPTSSPQVHEKHEMVMMDLPCFRAAAFFTCRSLNVCNGKTGDTMGE
jgi:hypothetical protein